VLANAVRWAHNPLPRVADVTKAPNVPADQALEPIETRGPSVHGSDQGFR
jgi:trehalose utilization protein